MKQLLYCLCLLLSIESFAQSSVSGVVTGERDNQPIPGISISVRGKSAATSSDDRGRFTIAATSGDVLVFSGVGFQTRQVTVSGSVVNVVLSVEDRNLQEVVVTGYTTRARRTNVGSAATVVIDDVRTQPIASFDQLLQGQAPGLNVKAGSGQPGRSADVIIRGRGSINGSVTPLYIVDGVEVRPSDFSTMNQGDFETVTVLKDASSVALYGSRGANGVIVVTTKKGRAGRFTVSYDGQYGFSSLPKNKLELMNTAEKLDFEVNIAGNPYGWSPADVDSLKKINTDWNDVLFRTAKTQSHQISAAWGNDKTRFYTSLAYLDQEGILITTGLKRYTGRMNVEHTQNRLKIGANLALGSSRFQGSEEGDQFVSSPLNTVLWALPYETPKLPNGEYTTSIQTLDAWINPVEKLLRNPAYSWQLKSTGNVFAEYRLPWVEGLTWRTNVGGDYSQIEGFSIINPGTQSAIAAGNGSAFRADGEVSRSFDRRFTTTLTNSLTYKAFLDKGRLHDFSIGIYNEHIKTDSRNFGFTGYGLLNAFENEAGLVRGTTTNGYIPIVNGGFPAYRRLLSYFGIVDYTYKGRYLLSLNARRDGSSRLAPGRKWESFGSAGLGWIVSDESFFKSKLVNFLKVRASYGSAGNQSGIGDFPYLQTYGTATYGGNGALFQNRFGNDELGWERRVTGNIAVDAAFFNNRVKATVEYYNSLTKGLYFPVRTPFTNGGGGTKLANLGSMSNKGIEVSLNVQPIATRNFNWTIDANFSYNKNTIESLPENQDGAQYASYQVLKVGKPMNSFNLVRYAGVDKQTGSSLYYQLDGKTTTDVYNPDDRVILGTSDAPYNGGITNTFRYKTVELSVFWVYSFGNYIFNSARVNVENPGYVASGFAKDALRTWQQPGDVTDFPSLADDYQPLTTRYLEKGDFWRLRNVQLTYSLPRKVLDKLKLQGLRLFAQGQNLYTIFSFKGWDPETSTINSSDVNSNGDVTGAQYPPLKTITFGMNISF